MPSRGAVILTCSRSSSAWRRERVALASASFASASDISLFSSSSGVPMFFCCNAVVAFDLPALVLDLDVARNRRRRDWPPGSPKIRRSSQRTRRSPFFTMSPILTGTSSDLRGHLAG